MIPIFSGATDDMLLNLILQVGTSMGALVPFEAVSAVRSQKSEPDGRTVDKMIFMGKCQLKHQIGVMYLDTLKQKALFESRTGLTVEDMPIYPAESFKRRVPGAFDETWECVFDQTVGLIFGAQAEEGKRKQLLAVLRTGRTYDPQSYQYDMPMEDGGIDAGTGLRVPVSEKDMKEKRDAFISEIGKRHMGYSPENAFRLIELLGGYNASNENRLMEAVDHYLKGMALYNKDANGSKLDHHNKLIVEAAELV